MIWFDASFVIVSCLFTSLSVLKVTTKDWQEEKGVRVNCCPLPGASLGSNHKGICTCPGVTMGEVEVLVLLLGVAD